MGSRRVSVHYHVDVAELLNRSLGQSLAMGLLQVAQCHQRGQRLAIIINQGRILPDTPTAIG